MTTTVLGSLPTIRPMLASPSTKTGSRKAVDLATLFNSTHLFDLKLDGLRCLLYWDGARVKLVNRSGVDITRKFPELPTFGFGTQAVILDGELVCDSGLFNDIATRGKQEQPTAIGAAADRIPARFIAFDLLWLGIDHRGYSYEARREVLDNYVNALAQPRVQTSMCTSNGAAMWQAVGELGLEGLIAKDRTSPYLDGKRSPAWLKFKTVRRVTCIAAGYEPGTGARAHFGAVFLAMIDKNGKPVSVGKVGTGFTDAQIAQLKAELDAGHTPLIEIEALNVGSGGQLRFPVFRGWRTDLTIVDVTTDQLDTLPRC